MKTLAAINQAIEEKGTALQAKYKAVDEATEEDQPAILDEIETLNSELEALDVEQREAMEFEKRRIANEERLTRTVEVVNPPAMPNPAMRQQQRATNPAIPTRVSESSLTSFRHGTLEERTERAYRFGQWFMASQFQNEAALKFCREQGIELRIHVEGQNGKGGALVPPEFSTDIIDLRERYGVFRRNAKVERMSSDTKIVPRRTGGLTPYFVAEAAEITESTKGWDDVTLTARKLAVLAQYSSELNEDAIIDIANDLASEISYAFALKEDQCGFNGDGTSTYGGIVGVRNALLNLSATRANIAGLVVASGNAYSEITLGDFNAVKARLPEYANTSNAKWFMSQAVYSNVAEKIMMAAGGITAAEIASGRREPLFMGYPVEITQAMPTTEANDQVVALFGDLRLAALFGDRRQETIAVDSSRYFEFDKLAIRGTERFDINVHDVGNADGTAANRVAGPIVGLLTAAA